MSVPKSFLCTSARLWLFLAAVMEERMKEEKKGEEKGEDIEVLGYKQRSSAAKEEEGE